MYASPCLLHTGQLQLPIQHRVRAAALQVYAAVQHGQGLHQQPVRRQQRKGTNAGTLRNRQAKDAGGSIAAPPLDNAAQHAQQLAEERQPQHVEAAQQEQQLAYVSEPWDLSESWQQQKYVDDPWQQQQQAYVHEQWEDHGSQQRQRQQQQPAQPSLPSLLRNGSGSALAAQQLEAHRQLTGSYNNVKESEPGDDEVLWLLEEDSDDETQQQQDDHDGWLDSNSSSRSSQALGSATPAQQYARQQQEAQIIRQQEQNNSQDALGAEGGRVSSSSPVGTDLQAAWDDALSVALSYLTSYDVRFDVSRHPPFSRTSWRPGAGGVVNAEYVSLTAAAAAAAAKVQHARRRQIITQPTVPHLPDSKQEKPPATAAAAAAALQGRQQQQQHDDQSAAAAAVLPDDPRWQAVQRIHAAYLSYMQQLSAMVVSRQQQSHQIVYQQVGICEHWLQLSHILAVFGGAELTPAVTAAMWKRLTGIVTRKVFTRMSHTERCHYDIFIEQLIQQSITSIQQHCSISSTSTQDSKSTAVDLGGVSCAPSHLASTVYSMAVLGVSSVDLTTTLVQAAAASLRQAAAEVQAADAAVTSDLAQQPGAPSSPPAGVKQQSSNAPAVVCCWGPSEVASMMWGLGTIQSCCPDQTWLENMLTVSGCLLSRCQSSQLWGVIWGFSRLGHSPPDPWLASWTAAAQQQLDAFNADALSHSIWALAELQYTPDKLWLRAFCGMLAHKIRSLMAGHLSMVLPALSSLGYRPRAELCRTIIAQARRHIHTFKPSQLCAVLLALASYPPDVGSPASTSGWHPGRLFLFDFISHSSPLSIMRAWSGDQASQVLWALSRFRYVPDKAYLKALLTHIQAQLPACSPDGLSLALWGLAALKQPLPSRMWGDAWCAAAEGAADQFGPQALAHGLSAMAALNIRPTHTLMQSLTRTASGCLAGCSCMELGLLIAALADQHWRPSDAWMTAFVSQVSQQLPAFENEDWGLLLYGLASLAQPLSPTLLGRLCGEVKAKLWGISGEGLGLLVWGIAQYDFDMRKPDEWWSAVFKEFDAKWESTTLRGCALAVVGLSQLGPRHLPPGTWEAGFINRYKALTPSKPKTWLQLLMGLRAAAGLEAGEQLVITPWMNQLLLQLGRSWNLADPDDAGGLAAINAQVAATAAGSNAAEGETDAASSAAVSLQLSGAPRESSAVDDVDGFVEVPFANDGVEPASATAVLL